MGTISVTLYIYILIMETNSITGSVVHRIPVTVTETVECWSNDSNGGSRGSGSCYGSSSCDVVDDEKEQEYWKNLIHKALHGTSSNDVMVFHHDSYSVISSTQEESDVSSYIDNHSTLSNIENNEMYLPVVTHPCTVTATVTSSHPSIDGHDNKNKNDNHDDDYSSFIDGNSMELTNVPFVSLHDGILRFTEDTPLQRPLLTADKIIPDILFGTNNHYKKQHQQQFHVTTATIPMYIYIQIEEPNIEEYADEFYLDINDATELYVYDHTLQQFLYNDRFFLSNEFYTNTERLYNLLIEHSTCPTNTSIQTQILNCIHHDPTLCQVRFKLPVPSLRVHQVDETTSPKTIICYPLTYFCITKWLLGVQTAYNAYPEAIGCINDIELFGYIPLAYACLYKSTYEIVNFLLSSYPDAIRQKSAVVTGINCNDTLEPTPPILPQQQLPLHVICQLNNPDPNIVQLLIDYYPTAAQIHDFDGYTPLMYLCSNPNCTNVSIITPILIRTSPLTIRAVTNKPIHKTKKKMKNLSSTERQQGAAMEYVLHMACTAHIHDPKLIQILINEDATLCQYTNMEFQLPLHNAVISFCHSIRTIMNSKTIPNQSSNDTSNNCIYEESVVDRMTESISLLIDAFPNAIDWRDDNDHTPKMIVEQLLLLLDDYSKTKNRNIQKVIQMFS
jgi:hypothetical protein